MVVDLRDGAVRHVFVSITSEPGTVATLHVVAFDSLIAVLRGSIDADAVDDVDVAIGAGLDGAGGHFPDAVRSFRELRVGARRRGNIAPAQRHAGRIRRVKAEHHPPISEDFRRGECRGLRAAGRRVRRGPPELATGPAPVDCQAA